MIFVYMAIFICFILLYGFSIKERHCVRIRSPMKRIASIFYYKLVANKIKNHGVKKDLEMLYPGLKNSSKIEEFYIKKISRVLCLLLIGDILAIILFFVSMVGGTLIEDSFIERNPYGGGVVSARLKASVENGEFLGEPIDVNVAEQIYTEEELQNMARSVKQILPDIILGDNTSLDEVQENMNLVKQIDGFPFQISWESDNYGLIPIDGAVQNEEIKETGVVVSLTALLRYEKYQEEFVIPVCVNKKTFSNEEQWKRMLSKAIEREEERQAYAKVLILPKEVGGQALRWKEEQTDNSGLVLLLLFIAGILTYAIEDRELHSKVEKRNQQIMMDYPMLVQKLTLYMGAGMTIRNAFRKICGDYNVKQTKQKRYMYEEMLLACHEMDSGISESAAYEFFGKRCKLPQYTKLASLLNQSIKRGGSSLQATLYEEAKNAFEERKNMAKKMGEEAGTKLLFPMMLMLMVVMVLIVIPAFFSFTM